jgi:hypothetical protein
MYPEITATRGVLKIKIKYRPRHTKPLDLGQNIGERSQLPRIGRSGDSRLTPFPNLLVPVG